MLMVFMNFLFMIYIKEIFLCLILFIYGEKVYLFYFFKMVYEVVNQLKELLIVKNVIYVDLYDCMDKILFDNIIVFFNKNFNK